MASALPLIDSTPARRCGFHERLTRGDYAWLVGYCLLLFGISLWGGRPLSRHEAVLPQTAREMLQDGDLLIPKSDGRPWLESPPLPQWITVSVAALVGRCDREWIVRIAPLAVATGAVLLTAALAAGWFGRTIGLLSGLILATIQGFTSYAWRAEDEIFLCGLIALACGAFAWAEFGRIRPEESRTFLGRRSGPVFWFFAAWGATNLAKGVLFGAVLVGAIVGSYLLLACWDRRALPTWRERMEPVRRYVWLWGWLAWAAIALAWPLAASLRYPDVVDVWLFDQVGRVSGGYTAINRPLLYYAYKLPEALLPWTPLALLGLGLTRRWTDETQSRALRFVWCWAWMPPLVLTFPSGKHHHYLLHGLAPWAILSAFGLVWVRGQIQSWPARVRHPFNSLLTLGLPGAVLMAIAATRVSLPIGVLPLAIFCWLTLVVVFSWGAGHRQPAIAIATLFTTLALGYAGAHLYAARGGDRYVGDAAFLRQVRQLVPPDRLLINAEMGQMETFHCQFYLDAQVRVLHNLSFLQAADLPRDVYLISYASDADNLANYGQASVVLAGQATFRDGRRGDALVLYRVRVREDLQRIAERPRVSPLQAMRYAEGPFLRSR